MPRVARQHVPGVVTHVITRFVNGAYVMDDVPGARHEYMRRLDLVMSRTDWRLLWYCLMGNHVHIAALSGEEPLERWARALNGGFAAWVNWRGRATGRAARGPVMADRPSTIMVPDSRAGYLAAYIHNNPVRAGLVERAAESDWSSHRALVTIRSASSAPSCMDTTRALRLCGYDMTREGRAAFGAWVDACRREPRNAAVSGLTLLGARSSMRQRRGTPTELATPSLTESGTADYPPHAGSGDTRIASTAPISTLLALVTLARKLEPSVLRSRGRNAALVEARRVAVLACRAAHRPLTEVCRELGISDSAASYLIRTADPTTREQALDIAERWGRTEKPK
jgi:hypothetical protein